MCGYLYSEDPLFDPAMRALPPVFVVRLPDGAGARWVEASITYALEHAQSTSAAPGQVSTRLPELVLIEVLRTHLATAPAANHGWLAALRDPVLRTVTTQIMLDEAGHLAFHVEYLRRAFDSMSFSRRILAQVVWRAAFRTTCLAVMYDHRALLRAVGLPLQEFWRDCGWIFDEVAAGIFSPAHVLAQVRLATDLN